MNTTNNLLILLAIFALIGVGAFVLQGGVWPQKEGPNDSSTSNDNITVNTNDPRIRELKNEIDALKEISQWDFSKKTAVESTIQLLQAPVGKIESARKIGTLKSDKDRDNLLAYHESVIAGIYNQGVKQFFEQATVKERFNLQPIYDALKKLAPRYREQGSPYNMAAYYYGVSGIETRTLKNIDTLALSEANRYMKKIKASDGKMMLEGSDLYQTVRKRCVNLITEKVMIGYRSRQRQYFQSNYLRIASDNMKREVTSLAHSSINIHPTIAPFVEGFTKKNLDFKNCDQMSIDTTIYTIDPYCETCGDFPFYRSHSKYQNCQ